MGKKRRLRANNPKFNVKFSTHPKLTKDDAIVETPTVNSNSIKIKNEPAVQLKPVEEAPKIVEKEKTTRKRRATTKPKTTTRARKTRAKKTET